MSVPPSASMGTPLAARGGLGSAPSPLPLASAPPSHMLPAPVCRHQGPRQQMCQSPFAAAPAELSPADAQHPQTPPACPSPLPGLQMPGRQPASVSRSPSSFWIAGKNLVSFSVPASVPTQRLLIPGWARLSGHLSSGRDKGLGFSLLPALFGSCSWRVPFSTSHLGAFPWWPLSCSHSLGSSSCPLQLLCPPDSPLGPPVLLSILCPQLLLPLSLPFLLLHGLFACPCCVYCRFPSSWRVRSCPRGPQSSPKMAPHDASPCRASWGPSPPSPCTDTARTRAVSGAAQCGHMAHPGIKALLGCSPWRPCSGGPDRGRGEELEAQLLPQPLGPSSPAVPWAPVRGRGRAGSRWGLWSPHCPEGISWSNCPEAPGPGP